MRLEIKDEHGLVCGVWVAKTSRGFNKQQLAEQKAARKGIETRRRFYAMRTEFESEAARDNYQNALLEYMTAQ